VIAYSEEKSNTHEETKSTQNHENPHTKSPVTPHATTIIRIPVPVPDTTSGPFAEADIIKPQAEIPGILDLNYSENDVSQKN
jgi:hypothetical protein